MRRMVMTMAAALAATVLIGATPPGQPASANRRAAKAATSWQDRQFLYDAAQVGLAEINAARLAQSRGVSAAVRNYAASMLRDHGAQLDRQRGLHTATGTAIPTLPNGEQQATTIMLSTLEGDAFDRAYAKSQVDGHRQAIWTFAVQVMTGRNRVVRAFALAQLPVLFRHFAEARQLVAATGDPAPPPVAPPSAEMQAVLDARASFDAPPITALSPPAARNLPSIPQWVRQAATNRGTVANPEPVADIRHVAIPTRDGSNILARVYRPAGDGPKPVLVYFHGGGFVIASINTYDASARALANAGDAVVVSVAYRQGPERRFPTAVTDALDAFQWTAANAASLGGNPGAVFVGGESAGGNLAATVAQITRGAPGAAKPAGQLLIYPLTTMSLPTPSRAQFAARPDLPLDTQTLDWFASHYLRSPMDAHIPWAAPLRAESLAALPPATVILAELDPLRSEGDLYGRRLAAAGVPTTICTYAGVTHEFFGMSAVVPTAVEAQAAAGAMLRRQTPVGTACRAG